MKALRIIFFAMMGEPRRLTVFEKIVNTGFNVRFMMMGLFDAFSKESIARPGECIYVLGEKVQIDAGNA